MPTDAEIDKKRRLINARFGDGAFEERMAKIHPHRCGAHVRDFAVGLAHWDTAPVNVLLKCLVSKKGEEPGRVYGQDNDPTRTGSLSTK
jgi:hypothetical protein